jgi:SAM-dependent methyltransferase
MPFKSLIVRALPAPIENLLRKMLGRPAYRAESTGEKPASWYDQAFEEAEGYSAHYSRSPYYVSWTVILDRIRHAGVTSVLEVACGPGQLACALRDSGLLQAYQGFDFADKRLAAARAACPGFAFEVADAFTTPLFDTVPYDVVIATEFLEHVNEDLQVIERIRPGARFIGTVPNYPYVSHVRHFADVAAVCARYAALFDDFTVAPIVRDQQGHVLYILEGRKRPPVPRVPMPSGS